MTASFNAQHAEILLSDWLEGPVTVRGMEPLTGGMVNQVLRVDFDRDPGSAVIKVASEYGVRYGFRSEFDTMAYLLERGFPVPEPYFIHEPNGSGDGVPFPVLGMEHWDAPNIGQVPISQADFARIQREMADSLLDMHTHTRETYGPIFDEGRADWAAEFEPRVRDRYENIEGKIDTRTYARIDDILRAFPVIFADQGAPTLVHGDIWATNVMISERAGDWHLKGFVDVAGSFYADVEFELAYLEAFQPIWGPLLTRYAETTPFREGYALRRAAYHLNTMIIHVDHFGDAHYVRRTEQLADEIGAALGL